MEDLPASPSLDEFKKHQGGVGRSWGYEIMRYAQVLTGDLGPGSSPDTLPWEVVRAMGLDPVVQLAEAASTEPLLDAAVYFVEDDGRPSVKAEVEAYLWPILPDLLEKALRAPAWGVVPLILTWEAKDLQIKVKTSAGSTRRRVIPGHQHPKRVDDVFPGDVCPLLDERGDVAALQAYGQAYGLDRALLLLWRDEFGQLVGRSSRRVSYPNWYSKKLIRLWRGRYLERSVDPVRLGWAPTGKQTTEDGQTLNPIELMTNCLLAASGGNSFVMPAAFHPTTNAQLYDVKALEMPERESVWEAALSYEDNQILLANKVPPAQVIADESTSAGARVPAELFVEFVEGVGRWMARQLTRVAALVHHFNHPGDPPPVVCARDLPKAKRKYLLDLFNNVADATRRLEDGRTYTGAQLVDVAKTLDAMGIDRHEPDDVASEAPEAPDPADAMDPPPGKPGPAKKQTSAREQRREQAVTDEGADATGAPGQAADQ